MAGVVVVPYAIEWPLQFEVVREELLAVFAAMSVAIEHVGSTAVPGLAAKPVIDVLLGAETLDRIEARIDALAGLGYEYRSGYERELPQRRYFVRSAPPGLRIHLHGLVHDSRLWRQHLAFRNALRADPVLRARYQALKLELADRFAADKSAYTIAKAPFIQAVLAAHLSNAAD